MSPDFFYKCEHDYPKAVSFIRQYIPLGWPEPEPSSSPAPEPEPEDEGPITITIREEELQKELVDLIHSVEQESKKEEIDIPRIMKVLAAARAMLEEEKERIRKDICEIDPNEIVQKKEEEEEKVETVETVEKKEVVVEEEEEEWNLFGEPDEVKKGEWGSDEIEGEDEETEEKMAAKPSVEEEKGNEEKPVVEEKVEEVHKKVLKVAEMLAEEDAEALLQARLEDKQILIALLLEQLFPPALSVRPVLRGHS